MDKDVITPDMRAVAQDYLTRRIENEVSFGAALETALSFAVECICAVVSKYGISEEQLMNDQIPAKARREIDDIVEDLAADLAEDVLLLAKDKLIMQVISEPKNRFAQLNHPKKM